MTAAESTQPFHESASIPPQVVRRRRDMPADRIERQMLGIAAWNEARRLRERQLAGRTASREQRQDAARELQVLWRTQAVIVDRTARELAREPEPMSVPALTAVVAHSHQWFADRVCAQLTALGLRIVECTNNGPDALGAVVVEQPDVLLVGDQLVMTKGQHLLAEATLFSPATLRAAQGLQESDATAWGSVADVVFLHQQPPAWVAASLVALANSILDEASVSH